MNSIAVGAVSPVATGWASKPAGTWMLSAVPPNSSSTSAPSGWLVTNTSSKRASCSAVSALLTSARNDSQPLVRPTGTGRPVSTTMSVSPGFMFVLKRTSYVPPAWGWTVR